MANTIELAQKFVPVIDQLYKKGSLTAALDASVKPDFANTNTVNVMKVATTGLGDYSRENGYAKGNVTVEWEPLKLNEDRSAELSIDRMDDEETLGQAFGMAMSEFMRVNVIPEVDAYRFAKYATAATNTTAAEFETGEALLAAIDAACAHMDGKDVPAEGRVLYISTALKPLLMGAVARQFGSEGKVSRVLESYNDMPIVYVPQNRFYTGITLNSGTGAWGYTKGSGAKDINFMLVAKSAVVQATKMALPKVFDPDTNQEKDAWKFQYRLYHDAFVYENKLDGIVCVTANA
jgi:hypothetical protein